MPDTSKDETIQMFFNEDFSPSSYVDALFLSISGPDCYSPQSLSGLNTKTQDLLTHLDYNTGVLLRELEKKMDMLKKLSSPIGISEFVMAEASGTGASTASSETSRLQYYIDSLKNAVETLSADVESVRRDASSASIPDSESGSDPIELLILLKEVKASILKVHQVIQSARKRVSGSADAAISDEDFQTAMLQLYENLRGRLREGGAEERAEIVESVKELRSWVPMFQPFTRFGPVFVKFVAKMENEL